MTQKLVRRSSSVQRARLAAAGLARDSEETVASSALNHPPIPSGRAEKLLRELLAPVTPEQFFAEYWEARYLHLDSGPEDRFESIVTPSDLSKLLVGRRLDLGDVKAVASGFTVAPGRFSTQSIESASDLIHGRADGNRLKALARDGATIILNRIHEQLPSLHSFCTMLGKAMRQVVWANGYITHPGGEGFGAHYDTHDVFILQINGAKKWLIRPAPLPLASADIPHRVLGAELESLETVEEVVLKQGDLLYLARGQVHSATCSDQQTRSIHITVGMQPITLFDVAVEALRGAALSDERLRRSFAPPPASGAASMPGSDQIAAVVGELAAAPDGEAAYARLCWTAQGTRTSGPADLIHGFSLDRSTRYRFAEDADLVVVDGSASIVFRGTLIELPDAAAADLTRLWGMESFSHDDLGRDPDATVEETLAGLLEDDVIVPE